MEILGSLRIRGELGICRIFVCLGVRKRLGFKEGWEFGKGGIGVFEGLNGVGGSRGVWDVREGRILGGRGFGGGGLGCLGCSGDAVLEGLGD